jgi:hypothetical protein
MYVNAKGRNVTLNLNGVSSLPCDLKKRCDPSHSHTYLNPV